MKRDVKKPEKRHTGDEKVTERHVKELKEQTEWTLRACSKYERERGSQHTEKPNASEKSMLGQKKEKLAALSEQPSSKRL
jgi:hypothetical protein